MVSLRPLFIRPGDAPAFPDPRAADGEGLVAVGGDLRPERLLLAYERGIFPWYDAEIPLWWSPDPRAVMTPERLHVSRSLRRFLRRTSWHVTVDRAFSTVMVDTVSMLQKRTYGRALWNAFGMLVLTGILALTGLLLGRAL